MNSKEKATIRKQPSVETVPRLQEILTDKKKVAVLFAVNNEYAPYLGVALASLVEHAGKHEYELIVLYRDLNERNREMLRHIVDQFGRGSAGRFHLRIMEMSVNLANYDFAPGYKSLSDECWYRLFSPELFPEYDKIVWLDADVLVQADVAELFAINIEDNWIAACRWDYGIIGLLERERRQKTSKLASYFTKVLGIMRPKENYVNSGVLLLNLRAMREQNVQEKLLQAAQNPAMHFHDQCAINMVCQGHIHYIDSVWNGLIWFKPDDLPLKYRKKALSDKKDRNLIHWAGGPKPWELPQCGAAFEWWNVARRTPYYEQILYTNICAIMRGELTKRFTKVGNVL